MYLFLERSTTPDDELDIDSAEGIELDVESVVGQVCDDKRNAESVFIARASGRKFLRSEEVVHAAKATSIGTSTKLRTPTRKKSILNHK